MTKLDHQPPLQRCACGTEWFLVHICPLAKTSEASVIPQGVPLMRKRILDLACLVSELQEEKARMQELITDLMQEIDELRAVLEIKQEQAREVHP